MNKTYWTKRGLLKRGLNEPDAIENEFLFGLEYWLLQGAPYENRIYKNLQDFINQAFDENGIMKNHIDPEVLKHTPQISHDQLTAYSVFGVVSGKIYHEIIWNRIEWCKYDGRFVHPRDWIFFGILNRNFIALFLSPLLFAMLVFTFARKWTRRIKEKREFKNPYGQVYLKTHVVRTFIKDSNEMLWWVRMWALKIKAPIMSKIFTVAAKWLCQRKFGHNNISGCRAMFENYYNWKMDHPNLEGFEGVKWP